MQNMHESVVVYEKEIMCDGSIDGKTLGHPRVYLSIQTDDRIECTYCGKVFIYDNSQN